MILSDEMREQIKQAKKIVVCQAENPDGDSLGSATALEAILGDMGKTVVMQCPVQIPGYLHYISGADRVTLDFPTDYDMAIIVDTSAKTLMGKTLTEPAFLNFFMKHPVLVLDHHEAAEPDFPFNAEYIISAKAAATGELIYNIAKEENWPISSAAAEALYCSIQSDTLGLTVQDTTPESFEICADLMRLGVVPAEVEEKRREMMKKSPRILAYKGRLIERIEYFNDGRTAIVKIPFDEIHEYSNEYNPTMLVIDEMRLVIGVDVAIGIKTYPDGKLTGKVRTNIPVANLIAEHFGGDGHAFAAGFRTYGELMEVEPELIQALDKIYKEYDEANHVDESAKAADNALAAAEENEKSGHHASLDGNSIGGFKIVRKGK